MSTDNNCKLFPTDLPEREFVEFSAQGYARPVGGVIYRGSRPPVCGVPLGGIETGCLDLEANGLWGFCSIFNSLAPRRGPINLPFLGISAGSQTWTLTTLNMQWRDDDYMHLDKWGRMGNQHAGGIFKASRLASDIHYWGHYPVVDMEFVTDCPVQAGLRAWSPFIPGDVEASNVPGVVFEVNLRNTTAQEQIGSVVLSFPGPAENEAGTSTFSREKVTGCVNGLHVSSVRASYVIGAIDEAQVAVGGELGMDGAAWSLFMGSLPETASHSGAAVRVEYALGPDEDKVIRFVLAWHCPVWQGKGLMSDTGHSFTHMYAARFAGAVETAEYLAAKHESLLERILAWQQVLYAETNYPLWLRDSLVNILHLITETAVWAQAKPPIGDWCREEDGLFAMNESPRQCPQMECIPCGMYDKLPVAYFFPQLMLSTLRAYKAYQGPLGEMSWVFGGCTVKTGAYEVASPVLERHEHPQTTLNGFAYTEMVDKLWRCSGDDRVLHEFYESVKKNVIYTMRDLCPDCGTAGVVRMPTVGLPNDDWYEYVELFGIVPHVGGVHLAQLRIARRMAEAMGDDAFVRQCDEWQTGGSQMMEEHTWAGSYYMLYNEIETGRKHDDIILGYQLDGEALSRLHGLEGVFLPGRVAITLQTLKETSIAMSEAGAVTFCRPALEEVDAEVWDPDFWGTRGVHPPGTWLLAMLYMNCGERDFGLELAGRPVMEHVRRGWYWDWACIIDASDGPRLGSDYGQMLFLWSLASAASGVDMESLCRPGQLVDRIIRAGNGSAEC